MSDWADDPRNEIKAIKIHMPAYLREELVGRARRNIPGKMSDDKVLGEYLRRAVSLQRFVEDAADEGASLHDCIVKARPRGPSFDVNALESVDLNPGQKAAVHLGITHALEELREGRYLDAQDTLISVKRRLTPDV